MATIIILNINFSVEHTFIWIRFIEDNFETFLMSEEYFGWVDNAEHIMRRFLIDCFGHLDEAMRDVTISSFISMLRNLIR